MLSTLLLDTTLSNDDDILRSSYQKSLDTNLDSSE